MKQNADQLQYYQDQTISALLKSDKKPSQALDQLILSAAIAENQPKRSYYWHWKPLLSIAATLLFSFTFLLNMGIFPNQDITESIQKNAESVNKPMIITADASSEIISNDSIALNQEAKDIKKKVIINEVKEGILSYPSLRSTAAPLSSNGLADQDKQIPVRSIREERRLRSKKEQLIGAMRAKQKMRSAYQHKAKIQLLKLQQQAPNLFKTTTLLITNNDFLCINQTPIDYLSVIQNKSDWFDIILNNKQKIQLKFETEKLNQGFLKLKNPNNLLIEIKIIDLKLINQKKSQPNFIQKKDCSLGFNSKNNYP